MLSKIKKKIADLINPGNTLYFPGCLTRFVLPKTEKKYKKILNNLNIDYITIPEFYCCGSPVLNAGYTKDFHKLRDRQIELFKKYDIKKIITNCPSCALSFNTKYGGSIKAYHISEIIAKHIKKLNKIHNNEQITYHDPCHLGRKSKVTRQPRIILEALGLKIEELPDSGENSSCCGAGGGLKTNNPKLSNKIAKTLLKNVKTKRLVTTCPLCYMQFKENSPKGLEAIEFADLFE